MALPIVAGVEFREIAGFEGYCVGSDGSVWSCRICGNGKNAGNRFNERRWRRLKPGSQTSGHLNVSLCSGGVVHQRAVHRIVLEAFVGPAPEGMEACHDPDLNPANNAISNLRWGTSKENSDDSERHGTLARGERLGAHVKLRAEKIPEIFSLRAEGWTQERIATHIGVSRRLIGMVLSRQVWKHIA